MIDRRRQILDAALRVFLKKGYGGTRIEDIRKGSRASIGSIYHAFGGKEAIAAALFVEASEGWASATARALAQAEGVDGPIRATVEGLIDWGLARPDLFRFLDDMRFLEARLTGAHGVADGQALAAQAYRDQVRRGEVRDIPWTLARALILGPAYDYLRRGAGAILANDDDRRLLSEAAWDAVKASVDVPPSGVAKRNRRT
jgi:AcrR family transcriptional regulator